MKKILMPFLTVGICFAANAVVASTSVTCESLKGTTWVGDLGELTEVNFHINGNGNGAISGDVNFSYEQGSGSAELDMLEGNCKENPDGTATIILNRNSYGISGSITATASAGELNVTSFTYSDPWDSYSGNGILKKS